MPSWNQLVSTLTGKTPQWLDLQLDAALNLVSQRRGNTNVILYASAFLQKPHAPQHSYQINPEDINGFMSVMHGMDWSSGLSLILHTPGGIGTAAETIVDYLWQKFPSVEVVIPTFAMSAGTMISLAADKIIMGRQSQLGPIDPQMYINGRYVSAQCVVEQFDKAKDEILNDTRTAAVWFPLLQSIGSAGLEDARNALSYGEKTVSKWLSKHMYSGLDDSAARAEETAHFFNDAREHLSHGRRINREEARSKGLRIEDLEDDQELQDAVLTAYHIVTLMFEKTPATKVVSAPNGARWIKNWTQSSK